MGRLLDEDMIIKVLERWQKAFRENSHYVSASDLSLVVNDVKKLPTIQPEKAQLSKEGTTSDLISKTETVEHLRRVLEATVPNTDYDEGFIDGVEFGISTVSTMPTIQPVATDTNVGDKISKFIDGLEEIFADIRERHVDDSVCGLCEYDGAYMGQSGDWCNECPGFDRDDCFKLSDKTRKKWTDEIIKALPTVHSELDSENLVRTIETGITATNSNDAYSLGMRNGMRWCKSLIDGAEPKFEYGATRVDDGTDSADLPPAQPEPHWIPCSERMPKDRKSVIVCYRYWLQFSQEFAYAIVIGWHASKFSVKAEVFTEWDGDFDYSKEQDENYIPEGWYEFTTQGNGDLMDWYIDAEVIAWMPLPKPFEGGTA